MSGAFENDALACKQARCEAAECRKLVHESSRLQVFGIAGSALRSLDGCHARTGGVRLKVQPVVSLTSPQ